MCARGEAHRLAVTSSGAQALGWESPHFSQCAYVIPPKQSVSLSRPCVASSVAK